MNIQQIAAKIDNENWHYSIIQLKPEEKILIEKQESNQDTADKIKGLIQANNSEFIRIIPFKKFSANIVELKDETIEVEVKKSIKNVSIENNKNNNNMSENSIEINSLAGLTGLGIDISEVFTAKDKTTENATLKSKVEKLEEEVKKLEKENTKLENEIHLTSVKQESKNELVELFKSPQILGLVSAFMTKGATTPALGSPEPQQAPEVDPQTKWLLNYLTDQATPQVAKEILIYVARAQQDENGEEILKEIVTTLKSHNIISIKNNQ